MKVDAGGRTVTTVTPAQAARELELRRDEFRLATQLGLVRTVPVGEGERRRVERGEIDRLKAAPDFPQGLRDRVRAVGTREAAGLLSVPPDRFTRLVRTGHLSPVRFYLNRYRAVVWLYLAAEVTEFARTNPALLTGRLPLDVRERLDAYEDSRPRNWRARRLALLLRATDDPWARAAAIASILDPVHLAEVVGDPYERAHLDRLRPPPPPGHPVSAAAREVADRLGRADEPDEILWHRMSLALALDEARGDRPAPHPAEAPLLAPLPLKAPPPPMSRELSEPPESSKFPKSSEPPGSTKSLESSKPRELSEPLEPSKPPEPSNSLESVAAPESPSILELPDVRAVSARTTAEVVRGGGVPARSRLLDRILLRKARATPRGRRGKRPVSWP